MPPQQSPRSDDSQRPAPSVDLGRDGVLAVLREQEIDVLRLQFCDLPGSLRHVDVPARGFRDALDGRTLFDGSLVGGSFRLEESDVRLRPDTSTLAVLPPGSATRRVAAMICDVERPDGTAFEGDSRGVLRRVVREMEEAGYRSAVGVEVEFFLLPLADAHGAMAGGEVVRGEIVAALEGMGIEVAATHAQTAPGQHEIRLAEAAALQTADQVARLRRVARDIAARHGLRAVFMPKPIFGAHGSGMHLHHTLLGGEYNAFFDPEARDGLSEVLRGFVGGVLRHARGFAAITNPLVNSYKRLVPGYAAPLYATWSHQDRTPLVRVPTERERWTSCEVRLADPASNPYLALAVQLAAGLDGIRTQADPGSPVSQKLGTMSDRELRRRGIASMPRHLGEALDALEENRVVRGALGEYVFLHYVEAKRTEWEEYVSQVHAWEMDRYRDV